MREKDWAMPGLLFMLKGRLCVGKKDGNTVAQIAKLAQPIAEELGLTLWDVRFEKEGADSVSYTHLASRPAGPTAERGSWRQAP